MLLCVYDMIGMKSHTGASSLIRDPLPLGPGAHV